MNDRNKILAGAFRPQESQALIAVLESLSGGATTLGKLTDVTFVSVADGDVIVYDANTGKWRNQTLSEAGIQPHDDLLEDIAFLTDPGGDRLLFWDDSEGFADWLEIGSGLTIDNKTISAAGGGGEQIGAVWHAPTAFSVVADIRVYIPDDITIAQVDIQTKGGTGSCRINILNDNLVGGTATILGTVPQITLGTSYTDSALIGWATSIPGNTELVFRVENTTGFTLIECLLTLE